MITNCDNNIYQKILLICIIFIKTGGQSNNFQKLAYGEYARIEEFPYVVLLRSDDAVCTGTIISTTWVLTAAHCLETSASELKIEVIAGTDNESSLNNEGIRYGETFVSHPGYISDADTEENDLGLIKVRKPFVLSDKVGILQLSEDIWPQNNSYSRECITASWGTDETQKPTKRLKKLNIQSRHGSNGCTCLWSLNQLLICTDRGRTICDGDSGGALICDGKGVGVTSFTYRDDDICKPIFFSDEDANGCDEYDYISAFVYICPHLNWIKRYVPEIPATPESCQAIHNTHSPDYIMIVVLLPLIKHYIQ